MATENEYLKKEETNQNIEQKHKSSWIGTIIDQLHELDTDFPLSGGDGHVHVVHRTNYSPAKQESAPKKEIENKKQDKNHTSWLGRLLEKIQDLDADFPLSGGEPNQRHYHHKN